MYKQVKTTADEIIKTMIGLSQKMITVNKKKYFVDHRTHYVQQSPPWPTIFLWLIYLFKILQQNCIHHKHLANPRFNVNKIPVFTFIPVIYLKFRHSDTISRTLRISVGLWQNITLNYWTKSFHNRELSRNLTPVLHQIWFDETWYKMMIGLY